MDVEMLISCVFFKKTLWDQKDNQHHNRFILDKLWDDVASEMKLTRKVVRAKWKALRDTFRRELKKRSVDEPPQFTSWQYFESLYFLKDQFNVGSSTGNLPDVGYNIVQEEENSELTEPDNMQNLDDSINADQAYLQDEWIESKPSTHIVKGLKRKLDDTDIGTALNGLEENTLKMSVQQAEKELFDEDVSFFESLLPHIRTLTPQNKMLLRIKVQELVYNFIYGNQANPLSSTNT